MLAAQECVTMKILHICDNEAYIFGGQGSGEGGPRQNLKFSRC